MEREHLKARSTLSLDDVPEARSDTNLSRQILEAVLRARWDPSAALRAGSLSSLAMVGLFLPRHRQAGGSKQAGVTS